MTTSPLFKRVPVEATEEMRSAGSRAFTNVDDIYRAMLAASPEPPAEEGEALRQRVKELEAALAPFSLIGGPLNEVTEGVFPDDASARFLNLGELKAKHFRVADTALARAKGNG